MSEPNNQSPFARLTRSSRSVHNYWNLSIKFAAHFGREWKFENIPKPRGWITKTFQKCERAGEVRYGRGMAHHPPHRSAVPTNRYTTRALLTISKEDKMKLEPSVATGCVDGITPMVWYTYGEKIHQCWALIIFFQLLDWPSLRVRTCAN